MSGLRGATTLADFGRNSDRYGEIPFYYGFTHRFWFGQNQVQPDDVLSWCRSNCKGYYKVVGYTHQSSERDEETGEFTNRVIYVDKIYLSDESDAMLIKLTFDVKDTKIMRPRIKNRRKDRARKA